MLKALQIFFRSEGANPWIVVLCLFLASFAEGVSIATLLPILTLAQGGRGGMVGWFMGDVVDGAGFEAAITVLLAIVLGGIVLKSALTWLAMRYVGYSVAEVSTRMRMRIITQLLAVRWSYLVGQRSGRFTHVINAQVNAAVQAFQAAAVFCASVIQTVVLLTIAFFVSWQMAVAALLMSVVLFVSLRRFIRTARAAGRNQSRRNKELNQFLTEALNNMKPVKAMGRDSGFVGIVEKKVRSLRKAARKQVMSKETLKNLEEVIVTFFLAGGIYAALVVLKVPLADLLVVALVLLRTIRSVAKVQQQYQLVASLEEPFDEIQELLAETAAEREPQGGTREVTFERSLELREVAFAYGGSGAARDVLGGVDLEVPFGRLVVVTGPSGVGKTTLVDLILGLHRPTSGHVLVDGVSLAEIDLGHWRRQIGYVAQELILLNDTIAANVTLGDPDLGSKDVARALAIAGATEFVAAFPEGVNTVVGDKGARLSGGQRQRIALARALVRRPRLLILDEVTSALDPETEREICANIRELAGETTVLAITHRPAFLEWADLVYRIGEGGIVGPAAGPAPRSPAAAAAPAAFAAG
jgi:ATP-binding cassette, subfamily C, bacterial